MLLLYDQNLSFQLDKLRTCSTIQNMKLHNKQIFILLALSLALVILVIWGVTTIFSKQSPTGSSVTIEKETDNPFPAPALEEAKFYRSNNVGYIQYNISPLMTNMTTDPIHGGHVMKIDYYNSYRETVKPSTEQLKSLDIGCIAMKNEDGYRTVKDNPSMFTTKLYEQAARNPNSAQDITEFEPWKTKSIEIELHPACVYLGTADLQYYWKIKEL